MSEELTKGFTCECGKVETFGVYVFAHWDEKLIYTCECGRKYNVQRGRVTLIKSKVKKSAKR